MRKITRAAKEQESRLRADLREAQRKLDAEENYAQKVKAEREELKQVVKRQRVEIGTMEEKVKTLEADASRQADELIKFKQQWTDTIQRAVEKCVQKFVVKLDDCFPGGTYEFELSYDEHHPPADSQAEKSNEEAPSKMEVSIDDSASVSSKK